MPQAENRRPGLPILLALLTAGGLAACSPPPAEELPPRPTLTVVAAPATPAFERSFAGEVRARHEQALAFRIGGKISQRYVDAGASVSAGQLLASLDPADTALAVEAARAELRLAKAELERARRLEKQNFVSQAAVDARRTAFDAASARADLAANQRAYSELRAGAAGVIGAVLAEAGQVVAAGQPVFQLTQTAAPEVAIAVPETQLDAVRSASAISVSLWAVPEKTYQGRLREVAAVADPASRTYAARIALLDADARVGFGMSASVRLHGAASGESAAPVSIPASALFQQDGAPAVWLVDAAARLSLRRVEVAQYGEGLVTLKSGLAAGERIVAAGVHKLSPGEQIHPAEYGNGSGSGSAGPAH